MFEIGEDRGDVLHLQEIHHSDERGTDLDLLSDHHQAADRVQDDRFRFELVHDLDEVHQMHLQTHRRLAGRRISSAGRFQEWFQVHPDRPHVTDDLAGRFLERDQQCLLAGLADPFEELTPNEDLPVPAWPVIRTLLPL